MSEIDFALNWEFIDPEDGCPRQLRFRRTGGHHDPFKGTGQLIAVVADGYRSDNGHTITLSRDGVAFTDVDQALDGWDHWAMITDTTVNLAEIRRRIHAAGLS
jgi:hypothetical protein